MKYIVKRQGTTDILVEADHFHFDSGFVVFTNLDGAKVMNVASFPVVGLRAIEEHKPSSS